MGQQPIVLQIIQFSILLIVSLSKCRDIFVDITNQEDQELGTIQYPFHSLNNAFLNFRDLYEEETAFIFQLMNENYMIGANGNTMIFFDNPNLNITIKPINCPNDTNEIEFCEVYSFIEIKNLLTRLNIQSFLQIQNIIFSGYDLPLSSDQISELGYENKTFCNEYLFEDENSLCYLKEIALALDVKENAVGFLQFVQSSSSLILINSAFKQLQSRASARDYFTTLIKIDRVNNITVLMKNIMLFNIYLTKGILKSTAIDSVITFDNVTLERYNYYQVSETCLKRGDLLEFLIEFREGVNFACQHSSFSNNFMIKLFRFFENQFIVINNSSFSNTTIISDSEGLLLFYKNNNFLIENSTFYNCSGLNGGIITVYYNNAVQITNLQIIGCSAENGPGLYSIQNNSFIFLGLIIKNCVASNYGGGICFGEGDNIEFGDDENQLLFDSNQAQHGGALYFTYNCTTNFSHSLLFQNCTSLTNGGAIYFGDDSTSYFNCREIIFYNNNAKLNGGAIYLSLNNYLLIESNVSLFEKNVAVNGGSLYFAVGSTILLKGNSYENSIFIDSFVTQEGGTIYGEKGNCYIDTLRKESLGIFNFIIVFLENSLNLFSKI